MKTFRDAIREALTSRLAILLEFEPCDAVQSGYFQYLDELRSGQVRENSGFVSDRARIARESAAFRLAGRAADTVN